MGYNRGNQQQGQRELMNIPLGGERKSSMFFANGKGKLVARGSFDVEAIHQAIEQASRDPRNTKPGYISIALFETDKPQFGILVCSPVRESSGGPQGGGAQRQWGQQAPQQGGNYYNGQGEKIEFRPPAQGAQQYSLVPPSFVGTTTNPNVPPAQWGPPPVTPAQQQQWAPPQQAAPSFQEQYVAATSAPEAPAPKTRAKKAAAKKPKQTNLGK